MANYSAVRYQQPEPEPEPGLTDWEFWVESLLPMVIIVLAFMIGKGSVIPSLPVE